MEYLMGFFVYVIFLFLIYKIYFLVRGRKNKNPFYKMTEIFYLTNRYKLSIDKIGLKKILNVIALSNAVIFSITLISTMWIDNIIVRILVMFILLFPLIFGVYHLIGTYFQRKGMMKNV